MLDYAAVDVVKEGFDNGGVAVGTVIIGEMAKVDVEGVEERVAMRFV